MEGRPAEVTTPRSMYAGIYSTDQSVIRSEIEVWPEWIVGEGGTEREEGRTWPILGPGDTFGKELAWH